MKNALPIVLMLLVCALATTSVKAQDATPVDEVESVVDTTTTDGGTTDMSVGTGTDGTDAGHTAEYVLNEAADDEVVTLRGELRAALGDDRYTFEDETGTVQVRIDDDLLGPDTFVEGLQVELTGEVDKDRGEIVEVEVEVVDLL